MIDRRALQGFDIGSKTAAVIGCGGLGCNIATHLACAGIGGLILFDHDEVTESNLNRQFLYSYADIGKKKVFLARDRLVSVNPELKVDAVCGKVADPEDLAPAAEADVVCSAVDNTAARRIAQDFCRERSIPLVNGGVNGFFGSAYLYIPGSTPDLGSAGMLDTLNLTTLSVSSTVGVIGALEAHLGISYLIGDTSGAGLLHVFDGGAVTLLRINQ